MVVSLCWMVIVRRYNLEDSEVLSTLSFVEDLPLADQEFLQEQSETRIFRVQTGASKLNRDDLQLLPVSLAGIFICTL